jgi:hypothetical protein
VRVSRSTLACAVISSICTPIFSFIDYSGILAFGSSESVISILSYGRSRISTSLALDRSVKAFVMMMAIATAIIRLSIGSIFLPLYRFLFNIFLGSRRELSKPLLFDIVAAVASLRLALVILLAVAAMPREGHSFKSRLGDLEPASLAYAVVRLFHSLKRMIYFDDSVPLALR